MSKTQMPSIRFCGFHNAWEQRKLGEIAEIVGGGTPSTSIPEYWDGTYIGMLRLKWKANDMRKTVPERSLHLD